MKITRKRKILCRHISRNPVRKLLNSNGNITFIYKIDKRKKLACKIISHHGKKYTLPVLNILILLMYFLLIFLLYILYVNTCQTISYVDIAADNLDFYNSEYYMKKNENNYIKNINKTLNELHGYKNHGTTNNTFARVEYDDTILNKINKFNLKQVMSQDTTRKVYQLESQLNDNKLTYNSLIKDLEKLIEEIEPECKKYR